jgi:soluble P-type ATPase
MLPGASARRLTHLVVDFNGTLAADGVILRGVRSRLRRLARLLEITVLTADTFGTAHRALAFLPVDIRRVNSGVEKRRFVSGLDRRRVVALGNGRNDIEMFKSAALSIAVLGPEGAQRELLAVASVVVTDVCSGLDLLLHPRRLSATLRK